MAIIAMSRELGSLGTVIGNAAAKKLKYDYVYQEITSSAARDYEVLEEKLIRVVEKAPRFLERVRRDFRRYQTFVQAQVFKAAQKDNVVLIGRWSTLLLRDVDHAIRVRVTAPLEVRARRVMEMMNVGMEKALEIVRENDLERAERMRHLYDVDWTAPHLYDLVLNTEKVSVEAGTELLVQLAKSTDFKTTETSQRKLHNLAAAAGIRARLKANRMTREIEVDVQVSNGQAILMGVVASESEKRAVERVVESTAGIKDLRSELRVFGYTPR
jgi:cytidylate kinase